MIFGVPINASPDSSLTLSIVFALTAGIFQTLIVIIAVISFNFGALETVYMFLNMRVIVQIIEEFLLFHILPSIISSVGMLVCLIGVSIMILFDKHENTRPPSSEMLVSPQ